MNCQTIAAMDDMFIEYAIMACSFARFKAIDTRLHYMNVDRGVTVFVSLLVEESNSSSSSTLHYQHQECSVGIQLCNIQ